MTSTPPLYLAVTSFRDYFLGFPSMPIPGPLSLFWDPLDVITWLGHNQNLLDEAILLVVELIWDLIPPVYLHTHHLLQSLINLTHQMKLTLRR